MINSKITFRFLFCFHFLLGAHAGLTVTPGDLVVSTGAAAVFNCSTNSGARMIPGIRTAYINWCNSASTQCGNLVNNDPNVIVYFNDFNGNFPSSRYSIDLYDTPSSERARNLKIPQTRLTDAGNYVCYDVNEAVTATAKLTVIDRPSCMGTTNGSYVALTCNVTYSGSGDNVRVVLQQNGQTIVNGTANVNTVTWSGNLANTSGLTCTVYSGISSSCTIRNAARPMPASYLYPIRSTPPMQADIAISSALTSASIIGLSFAIYFLTCGETNGCLYAFAIAYQAIYLLLALGIMISTAVATSDFAGTTTGSFSGTVNNNLIYQNQAWLIATLVISALIVLVQCALLPTTICMQKQGSKTIAIILFSSSVLSCIGSIIMLSWSIVIGNIFIDDTSLDSFTWTWEIFLIVFLVTLVVQIVLCVILVVIKPRTCAKSVCPNGDHENNGGTRLGSSHFPSKINDTKMKRSPTNGEPPASGQLPKNPSKTKILKSDNSNVSDPTANDSPRKKQLPPIETSNNLTSNLSPRPLPNIATQDKSSAGTVLNGISPRPLPPIETHKQSTDESPKKKLGGGSKVAEKEA